MPAIASTFESLVLDNVTIAIDGCDRAVGATLAMKLPELGARVRLRGSDPTALQALQTQITARWGRAELDRDGQTNPPDEARIAILASSGVPKDFLRSGDGCSRTHNILIVAAPDAETLASHLTDADRAAHGIVLPTMEEPELIDFQALTALVTFLLSPAGANIPNQCFQLGRRAAGASPPVTAYPLPPMFAAAA